MTSASAGVSQRTSDASIAPSCCAKVLREQDISAERRLELVFLRQLVSPGYAPPGFIELWLVGLSLPERHDTANTRVRTCRAIMGCTVSIILALPATVGPVARD